MRVTLDESIIDQSTILRLCRRRGKRKTSGAVAGVAKIKRAHGAAPMGLADEAQAPSTMYMFMMAARSRAFLARRYWAEL
jgi:hypothetical protein